MRTMSSYEKRITCGRSIKYEDRINALLAYGCSMGRHSSVVRVTDRYSVSRGSTRGGAREFSKILQRNLTNIINKWPRKTPTIGKSLT